MKLFLRRLFVFSSGFLVPVIFLAAGYLYFDPFKVIKKYTDYSSPDVVVNRDYISTEMFLNKNKYNNYNSFIFGSSRTLAFKPSSWKQYLNTFDNVFVFDASGESAFGILLKLRLLDSLKIPIKNALIVLCSDVSFSSSENPVSHLFTKHFALTGDSRYKFHRTFLKAYFDPKFLMRYYSFKLTGRYGNWMKGYIEDREIKYDTVTNELSLVAYDRELAKNEKVFYQQRQKIFYKRSKEVELDQKIVNQYKDIVREMSQILQKNNTDLKVILSPLYDQNKWNIRDVEFLRNNFGNNVFDFSGKNWITEDTKNYYETSHYRPLVGDSILKRIYSAYKEK